MSELKLKLFGSPHFEFRGQVVEDGEPRAIALAAYLAITDKQQTRDMLANWLWHDEDEEFRKASLDSTLHHLMNLLPLEWVKTDQMRVGIDSEALEVDVQQFVTALIGTRAHLHSDGKLCEECASSLNRAIDLYQDDFLAGFELPDSAEFDHWQAKQREWLNRECANILRRLAEHSASGALKDAIGYVQRWTAIDALNEQAHRLLMQLYTLNGQRDEALRQYEDCVRLLDEALATPPEDETTTLYNLIRNGETPELAIRSQQVSFNQINVLPPVPSLLIGREKPLSDIKARLGIPSLKTKQPITVIEGFPGVGKSTTLSALAHDPELKKVFPDGILWTSLGETPDLLGSLMVWGEALHLISPSKIPNLEELSKQVSDALRQRKMLLIVDDVWQVEHAVPFFVNGEDGALIMTSRLSEVAQNLAPAPSDVYRLPVLSDKYALSLLSQLAPEVVNVHRAESVELVRSLEGLPLAIQVAGRMLNEEVRAGKDMSVLLGELSNGSNLLKAEAPSDMKNGQMAPTVAALLKRSTNSFDEETLLRFALLGLFVPKPATFDLRAMASVWDVDDPRPTIRLFVNRGLIEPISGGRFQMHALLVLYSKSLLNGV